MRFAHIHAEKASFTVRELCETLDVSTSGNYAWAKRRPGRSNRIAYGVRQRVEELMQHDGLAARPRRKCKATTDSKHSDPIAPNRLERDFTASRPNAVWVGDVTAIATLEGWFFLAVLIDLHSRRGELLLQRKDRACDPSAHRFVSRRTGLACRMHRLFLQSRSPSLHGRVYGPRRLRT